MKRFILLLIFCLISPLAFAEILLQTNTTTPSVNQPFIVQVSFLNEGKKDYTLDGIDKFQVLGKSSKSSISIVNGQRTSSSSDVYQLLPLTSGKTTLQAKILNSQAVSNKLTFDTQKENVQTTTRDTEFKVNLKNNSTYYFGEKIPFVEKFLTTTSISSLGYVTPMSCPGISSKDVTPVTSNGQFQQSYFRNANGQQGIEITTYAGILMPNSSGEKTISVGKIGYTTQSSDDFFFGNSSPAKYLGGQNIKINVLPLPQGAPNNFQNVVGTPKMTYNWNRDKINFGESVVLDINISGSVNLDTLEKIIPGTINGFNTFESVKSSDESIVNGKYQANKVFEVAFIPRVNGDITIPKIEIPYFNTHTKKYENLVIPEKQITVVGNVNNNEVTNTTNNTNNNLTQPQQSNIVTNSNSQPTQEITINSISTEKQQNSNKKDNYIIIGLIILVVVEGIVIGALCYKRREKNPESLRELESAKSDREFYEAYCNFMKSKFKFSPKVHLEDRLVRLGLEDFIPINRKIEESYYSNTSLDKKETIKEIKKALKNIQE